MWRRCRKSKHKTEKTGTLYEQQETFHRQRKIILIRSESLIAGKPKVSMFARISGGRGAKTRVWIGLRKEAGRGAGIGRRRKSENPSMDQVMGGGRRKKRGPSMDMDTEGGKRSNLDTEGGRRRKKSQNQFMDRVMEGGRRSRARRGMVEDGRRSVLDYFALD